MENTNVAQLIRVHDCRQWDRILVDCGGYDTYHLAHYHLLCKKTGKEEPYLFHFRRGDRVAAIPFLVRSVQDVPGLEGVSACDATSVYGYPGLISNVSPSDGGADAFRREWQQALRETLAALGIAALFVRQHPLWDTDWLWDGLGEVRRLGMTVALDLDREEEEQVRVMRHGHRGDIKLARKMGIEIEEDPTLEEMGTFRQLYEATMRALDAAPEYFFPDAYYEGLRHHLGSRVTLFLAKLEGRTLAAALFLQCGRILQYHLSGSDPAARQMTGPAVKLLLDTVRRWGMENGFRWLHLGGGVGARHDSLFQFKAGFSDVRWTYRVVRCVVQPELYADLAARRRCAVGDAAADDDYFPIYRRPLSHRDQVRPAA